MRAEVFTIVVVDPKFIPYGCCVASKLLVIYLVAVP